MPRTDWPSIGERSRPLVQRLVADAAMLGIGVGRAPSGAVLVDAGIDRPGGLEAGRRIAEICMGSLGRVLLTGGSGLRHWPILVSVSVAQPVLACLGSQYAGWSLSSGEGGAFHALASGPGRALARREELFRELDYADKADEACFVLEVGALPPSAVLDRMAEACGIAQDRLTVICTPTQSLAGAVQIVARVLEVALHKAHALGFNLKDVVDGVGSAPLPPPSPSFRTAMGRTNDAILYGGRVHLFVTGGEERAADLARRLPSAASRDHGRPFREVFEAYEGDFYKIDPLLFSPAEVTVTALDTGRSFSTGQVDEAMIDRSFGHEAV
ncbi:MAG TPA: methenyltetrahydromethanopterin cyclohydrolase [Alphaproteobacteria bacterium]|nr:methenyltetrahydromethanopterin cyclohydrolase [Alphaproteobacteria bacterium]